MSDQSRDGSGRGLYQLIQLYPPPDFVKEASTEDLVGGDDLPAHVYADPRHRLYSCHTPAATWTSYGFFLQKESSFRPADAAAIRERFRYYGDYHSISSHLAEMEKLAADHTRVRTEEELPDELFAFVIKGADGSVERHCPMRNPNEVVKAAEYLMAYRDELPFDLRLGAADRIRSKAAADGVLIADPELSDYLEKQSGNGLCTAQSVAECLVDRVQASRKGPGSLSPAQEEMLKLAKTCIQKPSQVKDPVTLVKIAGLIDQYDREHGLHRDYGPHLPRVEDVLFGLTREKMASAARDHCATVTGCIYKLADLERLRLRDLESGMGTEFAEAVTGDGIRVDAEKLASIVPTLPRGDAQMFERLMEEAGVMPIAREKGAAAQKMSRDFLRDMANDYRQKMGQQGPKKGPRPDGLLAKFKG